MANVLALFGKSGAKSATSGSPSVPSAMDVIRAHKMAQADANAAKREQAVFNGSLSPFQQFAYGAGHGVHRMIEGAGQIAHNVGQDIGLLSPQSANAYNRQVANDENQFGQWSATHPWGEAGDITGQLGSATGLGLMTGGAADALLPEVEGAGVAANALKVGRALGIGGLEGASIGAAQPVMDGQSRSANAALGGALGALTPAALWGASKVAQAPVDAIKPFFARGRRAMVGEHLAANAMKAPEDIQYHAAPLPGMNVNLGAATNDPGLLSLSRAVLMKNRGLGLADRQMNQDAIEKGVSQLGAREGAKRAASSDLAQSVKDSLAHNKDVAKSLYEEVGRQIPAHGGIEPTNLKNAASNLLSEYPDIFERLPDQGLKSKLGLLLKGSAPTTEETGLLDQYGSPVMRTSAPSLSYSDFNWLDQRLGNYLRRARLSAGASGSDETRALGMVRNGLRQDFNDWVENTGNQQLKNARDQASAHYRENVAPFKGGKLKGITSEDASGQTQIAPEDAGAALIHPGKNSEKDLRTFMQATKGNPTARTHAANYLIQDIFERARSMDGRVAANRLGKVVDDYEPQIKALLDPGQRAQLKNIVKAAKMSGATDSSDAIMGGNSNTAAELANGHMARRSLLDHIFRVIGGSHGLGAVVSAPMDAIYKAPDEQLNQLLVEAIRNPSLGRELMSEAQRPSREVLQRLGPPGSALTATAGVQGVNSR